ncbi:sulfatase-like hydrolase/transferase [Lutibacter sp. A64]|uniref:sulfatase-like hydrolase/transferase n=1 Tax=Lutibacter sp. A64 TaxID=2918526 RepID=UPI001F052047|nr:sulfatase-like hydrolase/transferase [Lutibacter sp. A64]UMB52418.1 sulfatase-like hydrolase/transferase [Lutibacter sp. A64]
MKISIRILFATLLTFYIGCNTATKQKETEATKKPNVIVILIDDAGYADFGFMGSKDLDTPNIDALATSGVVLTDAHVSATVCAPSRAGIMTGKYQQRFGFEANGTGGIGLSNDVVTIADVFKSNGYKTYALGKWHLGFDKTDHPNQRGFDEFYGFSAGGRSYFPIKDPAKSHMLQHNGERVVFDGYLTDVLGDQSIKYIEQSANEPFFMYLAYNAVHTPMEAKKEDLKKYEGHPRKELAAMTWSLDENVGKLINKLNQLGIRDNTLIYFLSDNGGAHNNQSTTGPLKGWKGNKFEGGHRVPFIISYPNEIKGGATYNGLTSSLDIFATSIEVANITKPENLILDGVNVIPYLKGEKEGEPHKQLFWRKLEESAARIGDYKTIHLDKYGTVMYNLNNDLGETVDLSKTELEKFNELQNAYQNWETIVSDPLWDEENNWMDATYHIHKMLMQNKEPKYKSPSKDPSIVIKRVKIGNSDIP